MISHGKGCEEKPGPAPNPLQDTAEAIKQVGGICVTYLRKNFKNHGTLIMRQRSEEKKIPQTQTVEKEEKVLQGWSRDSPAASPEDNIKVEILCKP